MYANYKDYCKISFIPHLGFSVLEIVTAFVKASGVKIPVRICDRRPGDIDEMYASAALAEKELNWKCQYSLEDMCKLTAPHFNDDSL